MAHTHTPNRRGFLRLSAKLAALGVASLGGAVGRPGEVFAAELPDPELTDYKALVCVYLFGGNDGNNMIVPVDTARYTAYQNLRSGIALAPGSLLTPIADPADPLQKPYALHYGLPEINTLYGSGNVAFVLNMGQIDQPLTQADYLAGQKTPTNLFSHSDQTVQAQTGSSETQASGWGGRLLDCCGVTDSLAAVSVASPALFLQGKNVAGNVMPPGTGISMSALNFWPSIQAQTRRNALNSILGLDGANVIRKAANKSMADGLQLADDLSEMTGGDDDLNFPGTPIGDQLKEVARLIRLRSSMGPGRQVFFCAMGGYDLHSGQAWTHWSLMSQLSLALYRFHRTMEDESLSPYVTAFTQSEFGRTFQSSGTGSDHAWGSHQMVVGGAVKGGIYGAMPTFALGGPDDASNRGVWIPKISTSQFGATLGKWFGADSDELLDAFKPLVKFPVATRDLGFMNP
jgi:uncharacterized protein (DUF1501 family)